MQESYALYYNVYQQNVLDYLDECVSFKINTS